MNRIKDKYDNNNKLNLFESSVNYSHHRNDDSTFRSNKSTFNNNETVYRETELSDFRFNNNNNQMEMYFRRAAVLESNSKVNVDSKINFELFNNSHNNCDTNSTRQNYETPFSRRIDFDSMRYVYIQSLIN